MENAFKDIFCEELFALCILYFVRQLLKFLIYRMVICTEM